MKNYLSKAVLYKEWNSMKAIIFAYCFSVFMGYIMPFIDEVEALKNAIAMGGYKDYYQRGIYAFDNIFSDGKSLFIIAIIVMFATFIVGGDFYGRKYDALGSMPFKREEIILGKWVVGLLTVVIPMILTMVIINLIYLTNKQILMPFINGKTIFRYGILLALEYLFILTFIMLIQSLSGLNIFGGIIGSIFLVFPMGIVILISEFIRIFALNPNLLTREKSYMIENKLMDILSPFALVAYGFESPYGLIKTIVMLVVAIVISLLLMIYSFKKIPLERSGYLIIFKPLEPIFKIGVSVCFGLVGGVMSAGILSSYNNLYGIQNGKIVKFLPIINKTIKLSVLIAILCACIVYVITNKIIEMNKK